MKSTDLTLCEPGLETANEFLSSLDVSTPEMPTPRVGVDGFSNQSLKSYGNVGIRRFRPGDVLLHFAATRESIDQLSSWMIWGHPNYSVEDSRAFVCGCRAKWQKGEEYNFAIIDTRDGSFMGSVGLRAIDRPHQFANLGYWVRTSRTGQGAASAAARLVARFGLNELGLNRVELLVPMKNKASQGVAKAIGAQLEGVLRNRLVLNGEKHDALLYSLVADDLVGG